MAIAPSPYPPEIDAHLWRGFRQIDGEIKLGIVLEHGGFAPQWVAALLNLLIAETAVKLEVVYRLAGIPAARCKQDFLFRILQRRSERTFSSLRVVPISVKPSCCSIDILYDPVRGLTPDMRTRIASRRLDVLLWLAPLPAAGNCAGMARLGVWAFHLSDPARPVSLPPYWREAAGERVSEIALLRYQDNFEHAEIIASHRAPTQMEWRFTKNAAQPAWMAGPLLIRSLLDALSNADCFRNTAARIAHLPVAPRVSGSAETLRFAAAQILRNVRSRTRRKASATWSIGIRPKALGEASAFRPIPKPRGSDYAHPFVVENGGRHFVFFRERPSGAANGRISCVEIEEGSAVGSAFSVLEAPHHLSYPFVFAHGGEMYMIAESAASLTVPLYRARRFPDEWDHVANLVEGIPLVDTTPLLLNGFWYFFIGTQEPGFECLLFYADRLDGRWHYHPANPISSDARRAGPAGALLHKNGRLFRPSRDYSHPHGAAIVLNEIVRLSKTEYEEREAGVIAPNWTTRVIGARTFNANHAYEVIDGRLLE